MIEFFYLQVNKVWIFLENNVHFFKVLVLRIGQFFGTEGLHIILFWQRNDVFGLEDTES